MNYLVETKAEYTTQLINIICPFIYDGIKSLYDEALKVAKDNEELKIFQSFLKKIPTWNPLILDSEISRILKDSDCTELLPQLLNAVIKANIMILTNTPPDKKHTIKLPNNIDFKQFIHFSYIETAKTVYNNPYLFYDKYSLYDIKKNQRDAEKNIKSAIREAIRKLLPLQYILNEYLGEDTPTMVKELDFDKNLCNTNKDILTKMINKQDLASDSSIVNDSGLVNDSGIVKDLNKLKEMLKNNPLAQSCNSEVLDSSTFTDSNSDEIKKNNNIPTQLATLKKLDDNIENVPSKKEDELDKVVNKDSKSEVQHYVLKKVNIQEESEQIINSESVAYYRQKNAEIIDSFSNKSNIRSVFYSNEPSKKEDNLKLRQQNVKSVNTADVENYLKDQGQTTLKLSDDPNINSIKNVKTDKFKNKYYQV